MIAQMNEFQKKDVETEINLLESLYRAGDYKRARAAAEQLIKRPDLSDRTKSRVEKIASSMKTDKAAIGAFAFTFFVLLYLVIKYGI